MATAARVRLLLLAAFAFLATSGITVHSQTSTPDKPSQDDPLARPHKSQKPGKMENSFKKWRDEDVADIITADELSAFNKLTNDAERDNFIEAFWRRRDPTPDTEENEFKEEHYRRRAYADEHFSAGMAGSKTDRGRIYIIHGPPDSIDAHPAGGPYQRTAEEGGGQTSTFPFEIWRYRNIDHIGQEVEIEFVDTCVCGAYHITLDPGEKDALSHVPNAGPTLRESMGLETKADRGRSGLSTAGSSFFGNNQSKQFDLLERNALLLAPPPVKYKELKAVVDVKMRYNLLPFDVRVDFLRASGNTTIVPITIQVANRNLTYVAKDGIERAAVNVYGRLTTLSGQIVNTFEDPVRLDIPAELLPKMLNNVSLYQQMMPMRPGRYRLDLVLKDVNGDKLGTLYQSITVPDFSEELKTSTLLLADLVEPVPARDTGSGPFVLGPDRVRPHVATANGNPVTFKRGEKVNLWMQVYNLALDGKTGKPRATVEYRVVNSTSGQTVYQDTAAGLVPDLGNGITLKEILSKGGLEPGDYKLTVIIHDLVANRVLEPEVKFTVN